jgi:tripartite-type tricarboxylate transporter receptor subunit TctC
MDFAKSDLDRQALRLLMAPQVFGFPFAAPPGLLPEVRDMLRNAFDKTMTDPQFRDDATKIKLDPAPVAGAELERTAREAYSSSPETVARAKALIAPN